MPIVFYPLTNLTMSLMLLKKYKYIGQHPTKVTAVPYAPAIELEPGDELISQIKLPSHLFTEVEISAEEALTYIGAKNQKKENKESSLEELTVPQLVELLKENNIEIPKGTSKKADFINLLKANNIELPKNE